MSSDGGGVPVMPEHLVSILDGTNLEAKPRVAFLLLTTDADGGARAALLSIGETLAISPRSIALAMWPNSHTTANVARSGDATLLAADAQGVFHIRVSVNGSGEIKPEGSGRLTWFVAAVVDVKEDVAGYAEISSGIVFALPDPAPVLSRWKATIAALRTVADGT